MSDPVAYRSMVESVHEWPFTLSTYTRVALYLLLPVVTWGVGLVAEEILGNVKGVVVEARHRPTLAPWSHRPIVP